LFAVFYNVSQIGGIKSRLDTIAGQQGHSIKRLDMNLWPIELRSLGEGRNNRISLLKALETSLRYTKQHINTTTHLHRAMRFFFNLVCDDEMMIDDEGVEVRDIEHARIQAMKAIAELRQEGGTDLNEWSRWRLEVLDEAGDMVFSLHLNQTIH
jgi:hypothetical protein